MAAGRSGADGPTRPRPARRGCSHDVNRPGLGALPVTPAREPGDDGTSASNACGQRLPPRLFSSATPTGMTKPNNRGGGAAGGASGPARHTGGCDRLDAWPTSWAHSTRERPPPGSWSSTTKAGNGPATSSSTSRSCPEPAGSSTTRWRSGNAPRPSSAPPGERRPHPQRPRRDRHHQPARDHLVWNRQTGRPYANAIVWQDTRTDQIAAALDRDRPERGQTIRRKAGLPRRPTSPAASCSGCSRTSRAARRRRAR